jgi:hypothetical protein
MAETDTKIAVSPICSVERSLIDIIVTRNPTATPRYE